MVKFLLILFLTVTGSAMADESVNGLLVDTRRPLPLALNATERLVQFDGPVAFATRDVTGVHRLTDYLTIQNLDESVLIEPIRAFPAMRVEVIRRDIKRRYLIDLRYIEGQAPLVDLIVTDKPASMETKATSVPCLGADCITDPRALLVRFAAQQLYGPESLITPMPGLTARVPPAVTAVHYGGGLPLKPIGRWYWRGYRLDVLEIRNDTTQTLIIDPRQLRGTGQGAVVSAQRWSLSPMGQSGHTTSLYLVQPEHP